MIGLRAQLSRLIGGVGARADGAVVAGLATSLDLPGQGVVAFAGTGGHTGTACGHGTIGTAAVRVELDRELAPVGAFWACPGVVENVSSDRGT